VTVRLGGGGVGEEGVEVPVVVENRSRRQPRPVSDFPCGGELALLGGQSQGCVHQGPAVALSPRHPPVHAIILSLVAV
jgi:hypothetical protein